MTVRMVSDEPYRIVRAVIRPCGSAGIRARTSGDDLNCILSGTGKAVCGGAEEELHPGVMHVCPKGS